jgi:hypothetical protein
MLVMGKQLRVKQGWRSKAERRALSASGFTIRPSNFWRWPEENLPVLARQQRLTLPKLGGLIFIAGCYNDLNSYTQAK